MQKGSRPRRRKGWSQARPACLSKGGPNLRAFVVYPRFTQGISFARLAKFLSGIPGLDISVVRRAAMRGALAAMPEAGRDPFASRTSLIRARNRAGIGRDRGAGRQTELAAEGLPPQGQPLVPENYEWFSHQMGRETLCRHPLHHRIRPPPRPSQRSKPSASR
ncbi:MAG: hypothetical protein ACREDM_16845 [Methylocella sp.]